MIKLRRKMLVVFLKIIDIMIIIISFLTASTIAFVSNQTDIISFDQFLQKRISVEDIIMFLSILLLCHIVFSMFGLYHSRRFSTIGTEIRDIIQATLYFSFTFYLISFFLNSNYANPVFVLSLYVCVITIMIIARIVLRFVLKIIRNRGRNLRYLLFVGTNKRAVELANKIMSTPELGYVISGFVDDEWIGLEKFNKTGYDIVTNFIGFGEYIKNNIIDEVLITLPIKSQYQEITRIMSICEKHGIIVRNIPNIFNTESSNYKMEYLEDESFVTHYTGSINGRQASVKWMVDRILASVCLLLWSPVFIATAILIKLTSLGPIFFVQERIGLNKRKFLIYKFRTMYENAEERQAELEDMNEVKGAAFKIKNDPRVTKIGKYLRKFSIDEFPQIINVLKGDMSLVGPRPLPVRDYNGFDSDWYRRRFSVRPGITCLWQVNGRHNIPFERWMQMDMEYIDKWSLSMDAKIIFKTFFVVLKGDGAS